MNANDRVDCFNQLKQKLALPENRELLVKIIRASRHSDDMSEMHELSPKEAVYSAKHADVKDHAIVNTSRKRATPEPLIPSAAADTSIIRPMVKRVRTSAANEQAEHLKALVLAMKQLEKQREFHRAEAKKYEKGGVVLLHQIKQAIATMNEAKASATHQPDTPTLTTYTPFNNSPRSPKQEAVAVRPTSPKPVETLGSLADLAALVSRLEAQLPLFRQNKQEVVSNVYTGALANSNGSSGTRETHMASDNSAATLAEAA